MFKVLLVDDDPAFLEQGKHFLSGEDERLDIETATSAEEGLKMIEENGFEAVASDYKMGGMSGLEFLEKLREEGNDIPFIIITGWGREEIAMRAINLGADRYFQKVGDRETQFSMLANAFADLIENRRIKEKNEFLRSLLTRDIARRVEIVHDYLNNLQDLEISGKEREYLDKALNANSEIIEMLREKGISDEEEKEDNERFIEMLNRFLGYAYWSESQLEEETLERALDEDIEKYKDDLFQLSRKSEDHRSLLEELGSKIVGIDIEKYSEQAEAKMSYLKRSTEKRILAGILEREKFKRDVYKELLSSTDEDILEDVWEGDDPERFFEIIKELSQDKKEAVSSLKSAMRFWFSGELPSTRQSLESLVFRI